MDDKWFKVNEALPPELTHVVCYCPGINGHLPGRDWMDSDFCIGEQINGNWKRVDNANIQVSHWMPLREPVRSIYACMENMDCGCSNPFHTIFETTCKDEANRWVERSPLKRKYQGYDK